MIKYIIAVVAAVSLTGTAAMAADPVEYDFLNLYKPGGVFYKVKENVEAEGRLWSGNSVNVGSCAEAAAYLQSTDRPTIAAWPVLEGLTDENSPCAIVEPSTFVTFYGNTYFKMCRAEGAVENDVDHFINGNAKIGAYFSLPLQTKAKQIVAGMESNAEVIPYKSSRDYLPALEIGEIDYVMTSRWRDGLECIISGDPNEPDASMVKTVDYYDGPWSQPDYAIAIISANIVDTEGLEAIKNDIVQTTNSALWNEGSTASYNNLIAQLSTAEQWLLAEEMQGSYLEAVEAEPK